MTTTLENQISAINLATKKGFKINNVESLEINYFSALEFIRFESGLKPKKIKGTIHGSSLSAELPKNSGFWIDGEFQWNRGLTKVEELVQDDDGKLYIIVAKK